MPEPAVTGLDPAGSGSFPIEIEATTASPAAVVRALTEKRRFRTPGEGLLFGGEDLEVADDLIKCACMGRLHGC